jgi:hypothetical protein
VPMDGCRSAWYRPRHYSTRRSGWEHSRLLTADTLGTVLAGSLDKRAIQRSRSRSRQLTEVLSIEAQYVAVVDADHRFVSLVDRQALLEELAAQNRSGNENGA